MEENCGSSFNGCGRGRYLGRMEIVQSQYSTYASATPMFNGTDGDIVNGLSFDGSRRHMPRQRVLDLMEQNSNPIMSSRSLMNGNDRGPVPQTYQMNTSLMHLPEVCQNGIAPELYMCDLSVQRDLLGQNNETNGCGRGRIAERTELRRPHFFQAHGAPSDLLETEAILTGLAIKENNCCDPDRENFLHQSMNNAQSFSTSMYRKPFELSPYAKEFVPRNFKPEISVEPLSESYAVKELRTFLNEINLNPGGFEQRIQYLVDTLNAQVQNDDIMRAVVNIIFDDSIRLQNLRYNGVRLCIYLTNNLEVRRNCMDFQSVLLARCGQEYRRHEDLAKATDGGAYLRGFAMFLAELLSNQTEGEDQRMSVLFNYLFTLIQTIIAHASSDNVKCVCQILKLGGAYLEEFETKMCVKNVFNEGAHTAPEKKLNAIISSLSALMSSSELSRNVKDMITSVIQLKKNGFGKIYHSEKKAESICQPHAPSLDEPVMYGPDGIPISQEELSFLQSNSANDIPTDPDDYDLYNAAAVDVMPEELTDDYEMYLREKNQKITP